MSSDEIVYWSNKSYLLFYGYWREALQSDAHQHQDIAVLILSFYSIFETFGHVVTSYEKELVNFSGRGRVKIYFPGDSYGGPHIIRVSIHDSFGAKGNKFGLYPSEKFPDTADQCQYVASIIRDLKYDKVEDQNEDAEEEADDADEDEDDDIQDMGPKAVPGAAVRFSGINDSEVKGGSASGPSQYMDIFNPIRLGDQFDIYIRRGNNYGICMNIVRAGEETIEGDEVMVSNAEKFYMVIFVGHRSKVRIHSIKTKSPPNEKSKNKLILQKQNDTQDFL